MGSGGRTGRSALSMGEATEIDWEAAAAYVAELSRDLAAIARHHGLDALGFILEMAQLEAENAAYPGNAQR